MTVIDFNSARRQGEFGSGVDVEDIRARLGANARPFVDWIFSGRAYYTKNQARIGSVNGEQGSSLSIDLGSGLWHDHATGEGGDLIALYRAWRGYTNDTTDFILSLKELAADFLGDAIEVERNTWKASVKEQLAQNKVRHGSKPREENEQLGAPVREYRYYDLHGNIVAAVKRYEPDGTKASKTFRPWCYRNGVWTMGAPDVRPLYRLPEIAVSSTVVLCEGEGCADALSSIGIVATSAMQGAKAPIEKTDWSVLAGKKVIIWPDNDAPGFEYARLVAGKLASIGCEVLGVMPPEGCASGWDAVDCVAEGSDAHWFISLATPVSGAGAGVPAYRLYTLEELEHIPAPDFLISGVLIEGGLSMFWAGSDSFKTFVAIDMSMHVACGADWHGRAVKGGLVVYIAAEDERGVAQRMIGWRETKKALGFGPAKLRIYRDGLTLAGPDADGLIEAISVLPEKPVLIVIDTLQRTFGAGNENATPEMSAYVNAADRLRRATGANVMIIHHTGRNTEQERGNVSLRAACDTVISVRKVSSHQIALINTPPKGKQKNAEPFADIALRLQKVFYEHGGVELSTLIVMPDDSPKEDNDPDDSGTQRFGSLEKLIVKWLSKTEEGLGLTRLAVATGKDKKSVLRALDSLVAKGLVSVDQEAGRKIWRLND